MRNSQSGLLKTDVGMKVFVLKREVRYCQENCVLQGCQKDGQLVDLHSLPFSALGLRHVNVAGGKG